MEVHAVKGAMDGVVGGAGAVATDTEEDHEHHDEADGRTHAQCPLDAEHVGRGIQAFQPDRKTTLQSCLRTMVSRFRAETRLARNKRACSAQDS